MKKFTLSVLKSLSFSEGMGSHLISQKALLNYGAGLGLYNYFLTFQLKTVLLAHYKLRTKHICSFIYRPVVQNN